MPPPLSLLPWQKPYAGADREAIWTGLFGHLRNELAGYFVTISRRHIMPPALSVEAQPALFVVQAREQRTGSLKGTPNKLSLHGFLILYLPAAETSEAPGSETELAATALNQIFQAIDNALAPDNLQTGKFTLGGLVTHCWIEGDLDQDPGIFNSQASAIIPIHILVP